MTHWYGFALAALILMGTQRFLYKVSAERDCNTAWTTFSFMATVSVLSLAFFFLLGQSLVNPRFLLWVALINSGAFLAGTMAHMEALKHIPAAVAYSIIRLNVVLVVLFSIFFFKDRLSVCQGAGVVLAVAVILMLTRQPGEPAAVNPKKRWALILVFISLSAGAVASVSSKFAATHTNMLAFMAVSYLFSTLFAFGSRRKLAPRATDNRVKDAVIIGILMGVINFAGYFSFLKALSMGPLSLIVTITGMHFVIAVVLSAVIYKEKLTVSRIWGICLTIVSIVLMRL